MLRAIQGGAVESRRLSGIPVSPRIEVVELAIREVYDYSANYLVENLSRFLKLVGVDDATMDNAGANVVNVDNVVFHCPQLYHRDTKNVKVARA